MSVMDPLLHKLDPDKHLDLKLLFAELDNMFFIGVLNGVDVAWSSRLKTIGGYCRFDPATQNCLIRINETYYRTRPRSELIGVMLHEMVHAVLFLHDNEEDDGDHGPLFRWYVDELNKELGGKITVSVEWDADRDEVFQHWWQCNGPCQDIIKRAINRYPSIGKKWRPIHKLACGGTYIKMREPQNNTRKGKRKRKTGTSSNPSLSVGIGSHQNKDPKRRRVA